MGGTLFFYFARIEVARQSRVGKEQVLILFGHWAIPMTGRRYTGFYIMFVIWLAVETGLSVG